jgi:hypothetical protein
MKIQGNTIFFKSSPEFFNKEIKNIKNNTIRTLDASEEELLNKMIDEIELIGITSTTTGFTFVRTLRDISFYSGIWIFTWVD